MEFKSPSSVYESFDPETMPQEAKDKYEVVASGEVGIDTGRTRHRVVCKSCGLLLHPNTTWAPSYMEIHESDGCKGSSKKLS